MVLEERRKNIQKRDEKHKEGYRADIVSRKDKEQRVETKKKHILKIEGK